MRAYAELAIKAKNDCKTFLVHLVLSNYFKFIKEFRCYEAKIKESEKAGSHRESNPGHLWLEPPFSLFSICAS